MSAKPSDAAANRDALDEILEGERRMAEGEIESLESESWSPATIHAALAQLAAIRAERDAMREAAKPLTMGTLADMLLQSGAKYVERGRYEINADTFYNLLDTLNARAALSSPAAAERSGET